MARAVRSRGSRELRSVEEEDSNQGPAPTPRNGFVLGFALLGLITVVIASITTRVNEIPISAEFGLLQLLPVSYWMGLSMMGVAMALALRNGSKTLIILTGALFFAIFAGTPVLFEPNPPVWDGYVHLSAAQELGVSGHLPTALDEYSTNWPGAFLVVWFLSAVGAVVPLHLLGIFPFLTGGLTFLALFVFLRSLFPHFQAAVGSILGSLLNVWAQFHLSPQSLGLFIALLVLGTVWQRGIPLRFASIILFVGLVVIHPISTILLLSVLIVDVAIAYVRRLRQTSSLSESGNDLSFAHSPALPFGAAWIGWLFFQATGSSRVAESTVLARIGAILEIPEQAVNLATARAIENIFVWAPLIRSASLLTYAVIVVIALVLLSRKPKSRRLAHFLWAAIVGTILVGGSDILFFQGIFFDRSLMLFSILAPAICLAGISASKMRRLKRHSVMAVLLVTSMAAASTIYYQEVFYFVSDESVAVSGYLQGVKPDSIVLDGLFPMPVWLDFEDRTPRTDFGFFVLYPITFEELSGEQYVYAVFDPAAKIWYQQWRGIDIYRSYEANRSSHSLIYANGVADIYLVTSPEMVGNG